MTSQENRGRNAGVWTTGRNASRWSSGSLGTVQPLFTGHSIGRSSFEVRMFSDTFEFDLLYFGILCAVIFHFKVSKRSERSLREKGNLFLRLL